MILHFLIDSHYSNSFIEYVNNKFPSDESKFICFATNELKYIKQTKNVLIEKSNSILYTIKLIVKILREYHPEKVFVHFLSNVHIFVILLTGRRVKTYWRLWGADFYSNIDYDLYDEETKLLINYKKTRKKFKDLFMSFLRRRAIKKVDYIATTKVEFGIVKKYFKTTAMRVDLQYPNPAQTAGCNIDKENLSESSKKKVILLGNSGDPTNNHISILRKLGKLDCDYEVIVPLSYGSNKEYINNIQKIGKEVLGEHFKPVVDFMSGDEYLRLLSKVDVAFMNHYRQQAIGNLRILLSQGKKVYLSEKNPLFHYYSDEGIKLSSIEDCKFDLSIFDDYSSVEKDNNRKIVESIYSQDNIYGYMQNLFS